MKDGITSLITFLDEQEKNRDTEFNKIIPVEEWVNDPYYIGRINLWDFWKEQFIKFWNGNFTELIITGSSRSGKTFFTNLLLIRQIYELSVYTKQLGSANLKFGLDISSIISMIMLSITIDQAERTTFSSLRNMIDSIPYFKEHFPRKDDIKSKIFFDKERIVINVATSYFTSLLGSNCLIMVLDEANMINSSISSFEDAMNIYTEARNRRTQTFTIDHKTYGFNVLISSADTEQSFIDKRIEEQVNDPKTMIIRGKKFEITPERFSKDYFWMFVGDKNFESFVVNTENKLLYKDFLEFNNIDNIDKLIVYERPQEVIIPDNVKDVFEYAPIDFYPDALIDVNKILKDVCGRSLGVSGNFFNNVVAYKTCINNKVHPFFKDEIEVSTESKFNELIEALKPDFIGNKNIMYTVSLDLSKNNDSTGLALGHFDIQQGKAIVDMMITILPPSNKSHKIRYDSIKDFIEYLINKRNFRITCFYCDGYQSEYFIQYFTERKIKSELLSVDKTDNQYVQVRNRLLEGSVELYDYERFRKELFNLIHYRAEKKVNHKKGLTKDISDAVCRLIYGMFMNYGTNSKSLTPTIEHIIKNRKNMVNIDKMTKNEVLKIEYDRIKRPDKRNLIIKRKQPGTI